MKRNTPVQRPNEQAGAEREEVHRSLPDGFGEVAVDQHVDDVHELTLQADADAQETV